MATDLLTTARAEALFASDLSADSHPTPDDVTAAISHAVRTHGGTRGCAIILAGEYSDHPEIAALRMRWALAVVQAVYPRIERGASTTLPSWSISNLTAVIGPPASRGTTRCTATD